MCALFSCLNYAYFEQKISAFMCCTHYISHAKCALSLSVLVMVLFFARLPTIIVLFLYLFLFNLWSVLSWICGCMWRWPAQYRLIYCRFFLYLALPFSIWQWASASTPTILFSLDESAYSLAIVLLLLLLDIDMNTAPNIIDWNRCIVFFFRSFHV